MSIWSRLYRIARSQLRGADENPRPERGAKPENGVPPYSDTDAPRVDDDVNSPAGMYYANLELEPGASFEEIRSAYRRLLRRYHPDKHQDDVDKARSAEAIAKQLNEAMAYFEHQHRGGRL